MSINLLSVSRSWFYARPYAPRQAERDVALRDAIERMVLEFPGYGYRRVTAELHRVSGGLRSVWREADDIASHPSSLDAQNRFAVGADVHLLTSAAIYGANASGKSNLIAALDFMRTFVVSSVKETPAEQPIAVEPFLLGTETKDAACMFARSTSRICTPARRRQYEATTQRTHQRLADG